MRPTPALKLLGRLLELLLLALIVAAGAIALRLAAGPIPLDPVAPYIARVVERASPFAVSFTEPALAWSQEQQTLQLRVRDLQVRTEEGAFVASAPVVGVRFDLPALLRQGAIRVREAEVVLPALQLVRQADGRLVLNFGGQLGALPLAEATGGGVLGRLAGGAAGAGDRRLDRLRRIRVAAEGLQYVDEASGRVVQSGRARLRLTREVAVPGWELRLDAAAIGGAADSRLRLTARPAAGSATAQQVAVELERAPAAAIDGLLPELPLSGVTLPLSADLRLTFDPRTRVPGPGTFRVSAPAGEVRNPALFPGPLRIGGLALAGEAGEGWRDVRLTRAELRVEEAVLRASGRFERDAAAAAAAPATAGRLRLDLTAERLDAPTLGKLWPLTLAPGTRKWFTDNVDAGTVPAAQVDLALPAPGSASGTKPAYGLGFEIAGGAARVLPDWPAAEGLAGTARLDRDRFVLDLAAGRIGEVAASKGRLTFTDLATPQQPPRLAVELDVAGSVPAALGLLARKPLELADRLGIPADATGGEARATIALSLPLKKEIKPEDVTKTVTAALRELTVRQVRPGFDVTAGDLAVKLDDATADITGDIALNTVPAKIVWRERLAGKGERRRIDVAGTLDPARSKALGAPWPEGLAGEVPLTAVVTEADRRPRRIEAEGDLARLRVDRPELGLVKRAGEQGRLEARIDQPEEKRLTIAEASASWGEVALRGGGEVRLGPFDWRRVDLAAVRTPLAELRGSLAKDSTLIRADIDAARLDLRPYRAAERPAEDPSARGPDLDLALRAARLHLGPEPLEAVTLAASRRADRLATADVQTRLPGGGTATFSLKAAALPGEFAGETSDLGGLLRGLDVRQSRIEGGRGRVAGRVEAREGRRAWDGEAKLRELVVRDAPFLARLLTLASLQGLGNALSGQSGLEVTRVTVPFTWFDDGRIELRQARMVGSGLGGRVDGTIDTAAGTLALSGTIAPLYALNRLIGQIPILGNLLRGDRADAALAATFSVGGTFAEPQVTVNPLAALVPGAIRDLFGDLFEGASPAEQREPEARD